MPNLCSHAHHVHPAHPAPQPHTQAGERPRTSPPACQSARANMLRESGAARRKPAQAAGSTHTVRCGSRTQVVRVEYPDTCRGSMQHTRKFGTARHTTMCTIQSLVRHGIQQCVPYEAWYGTRTHLSTWISTAR